MGRINVRKEKNIAFDDVKKLYYITLDFGKDKSGKRVKKTKTCEKLHDAKILLKKHEADKTNKKLVIPLKETLEDYINYWMKNIAKNCKQTTLYGYKNITDRHIIPYLGKINIQKLTHININNYFTYLKEEKGLSDNTIKKHYELLNNILKNAHEIDEKIIKNPIVKAVIPKVISKERYVYNKEQLLTLFNLVVDDRMEIVVCLGGFLGLRRSEIAGLKWDKVDFINNTITISEARTQAGKKIITGTPKSESSIRTLCMPKPVKKILLKVKQQQEQDSIDFAKEYCDQGYVMAWSNGLPVRPNYLSDLFTKLLKDNNLPHIRLHDLRHSFASVAHNMGISIYDISKILGHSDIGVTSKTYTHLFEKTHAASINKIASAFDEL